MSSTEHGTSSTKLIQFAGAFWLVYLILIGPIDGLLVIRPAILDLLRLYYLPNGLISVCTANDTTSCASVSNQISFVLGNPNDIPLGGKWNASFTHFGAGVFRPSNGLIYLKNNLTTGYADDTMVLGIPGDEGLAGDWNGDGLDSPASTGHLPRSSI